MRAAFGIVLIGVVLMGAWAPLTSLSAQESGGSDSRVVEPGQSVAQSPFDEGRHSAQLRDLQNAFERAYQSPGQQPVSGEGTRFSVPIGNPLKANPPIANPIKANTPKLASSKVPPPNLFPPTGSDFVPRSSILVSPKPRAVRPGARVANLPDSRGPGMGMGDTSGPGVFPNTKMAEFRESDSNQFRASGGIEPAWRADRDRTENGNGMKSGTEYVPPLASPLPTGSSSDGESPSESGLSDARSSDGDWTPTVPEFRDSPVSVPDVPTLSDGRMPNTLAPEATDEEDGLRPVQFDRSLGDDDPEWWKRLIENPLHPANQTEPTDTYTLVQKALLNSPRIQAVSQTPLIQDLRVVEAEAAFDTSLFVRSQFDDGNLPVGDVLTTGTAPFLKENIWTGEVGLRKKVVSGGELEIGQVMGFKNSNSDFFTPQDQGTATLALNLSQPLLKGRGEYYNRSQIMIAQSVDGAAWESFEAQLQDEVQKVVNSYWQLYLDRSLFFQKRRNVARGETVLKLLEGRQEFDAMPNQIARARSAVLSRRSELANSFRNIRNSETELRRLIADKDWRASQDVEFLPAEAPIPTAFEMPLETVVETALKNRAEIREALERSKIAAIEYDVSINELLPELTFLFNTYVSGLEGRSGVGRAFAGQFSNVPGYSVGLEFQVPIQNRAARSRMTQRDLRKAKIKSELEQSIQDIVAEAQVADRRLRSAIATVGAALSAIEAARADLIQNQKRWESFGLLVGDIADGLSPTNVLDQLLDSQDRLVLAEHVFTQAEVEMKIAEVDLQRAMGTLLQHRNISSGKSIDGGRPALLIEQGQ